VSPFQNWPDYTHIHLSLWGPSEYYCYLGHVKQIWTLWKWRISKSVSSANMYVIKKLTVNYDTPRQYLNCHWIDCWYSYSFGVMWPSKSVWPLMRSQLAVMYGACFYLWPFDWDLSYYYNYYETHTHSRHRQIDRQTDRHTENTPAIKPNLGYKYIR